MIALIMGVAGFCSMSIDNRVNEGDWKPKPRLKNALRNTVIILYFYE